MHAGKKVLIDRREFVEEHLVEGRDGVRTSEHAEYAEDEPFS
jgi:hypothetical protein